MSIKSNTILCTPVSSNYPFVAFRRAWNKSYLQRKRVLVRLAYEKLITFPSAKKEKTLSFTLSQDRKKT